MWHISGKLPAGCCLSEKMAFRFALFDFDGVIADTEESNRAFLEKALARHGIFLSDGERNALVGVNDPELLKSFLARAETPVTLEQFRQERKLLGNTYENGNLQPMPGLLPLLHRFREQSIRMAVVSSTSGYLIAAALRRLGMEELFEFAVCGDMVHRKKPDPEPYRMAMERLHAKPEECVIFEDSPVGIRAGKAAGGYVIAYRGGNIRQDTSGADAALDSYFSFNQLNL